MRVEEPPLILMLLLEFFSPYSIAIMSKIIPPIGLAIKSAAKVSRDKIKAVEGVLLQRMLEILMQRRRRIEKSHTIRY